MVDRVVLANYLAETFPGPGVRRQIQAIVDFVQQDEVVQQDAVNAWSGAYQTQLEAQKAEAEAAVVAIDAKIAALSK